MRKIFLFFCFISISFGIFAKDDSPLWLRYSSISPDGKQIAFCYKGNIFKVASSGGKALQLTSHPAHDTRPIWSPDGKKIAFSSNRLGSFDVYIVSEEGGKPERITTHSANEYPIVFRTNESVLYSASIIPDVDDGQFPSDLFPQIYEVKTSGGRPSLFSSLTMEDISFNKAGDKILYHNKKGYEDNWRKHHKSSITRDIWLCELGKEKKYEKLTSSKGEERSPIWTSDEKAYYYLSEENGSFNIFKRGLNDSKSTQITKLKNHPVRFLSISNNGVLCFSYNGEIYSMNENEKPKKVNIQITTDSQENELKNINFSSGAREMALSPNGKEIAFIIRGDIFVASIEYGTTRRITNTPEQERFVSFSPDGRSILYSAERSGFWNLYQTSLKREEDDVFVYAHDFKEEQLTKSEVPSFQALYSPDGKEIAYLENRTAIKVLNLETKKSRLVLGGEFNYSYSDGDQSFKWSPDSKYILTKYIGVGGWHNVDVALVDVSATNKLTNLTESGYNDINARFVLDGKAMVWFSDRAGYRSHGSWGSQYDAYIMFFDNEAYDKFRMSKEELALLEEIEKKNKEKQTDTTANKSDKKETKDKKDKKSDEKNDKNDDKKDDKKDKPKDLKFELENRSDYVIRLTPNSSMLSDVLLNKKGDKLFYLSHFEKNYDLWVYDLKEKSTKILLKSAGGGKLVADKDEKNILLLSGGQIKKINMDSGKLSIIKINAEFDYLPKSEREYMYYHAWKQMKDKFYVVDMHNVDWAMYKTAYQRFLDHINNNYDFAEMLSELLGELNVSHTGARYRAPGSTMPTATLGAFFDNDYNGDGLKIKEIIAKGPLSKANSKIKQGSIILKIDEKEILKGKDYYPLLAGKAGKRTLITFKTSDSGEEQEEWIKPISNGEEANLLYKRWVNRTRKMTDELSNGRIGYVHVRGMNSASFREVYSELLGRCRNKDAVVVDTRNNGGGWLHDDLVTLLSGKEYQRFVPRDVYIASDPFNKWIKPSIVLVCENNYSNAHGFPWLYKELSVGKLVGTPVPGTMTAVWWETQIDPSIVFGVPQVAIKDMRGKYLENQELLPDVEVYNDPASLLKGEDKQLEKAVQILLNSK